MGQIVGGAAKPKRCNLNKLSQLGTPAAGEYILVSSDNSMNASGQGNFDCYIVGDGTKTAMALELKKVANSDTMPIVGSRNTVESEGIIKFVQLGAEQTYTLFRNEYVEKTGVIAKYSGWARTPYLYVKGLGTLEYTASRNSEYNVFYDENFQKLTNFDTYTGTNSANVREDAVWCVMSNTTAAMESLVISNLPKFKGIEEIVAALNNYALADDVDASFSKIMARSYNLVDIDTIFGSMEKDSDGYYTGDLYEWATLTGGNHPIDITGYDAAQLAIGVAFSNSGTGVLTIAAVVNSENVTIGSIPSSSSAYSQYYFDIPASATAIKFSYRGNYQAVAKINAFQIVTSAYKDAPIAPYMSVVDYVARANSNKIPNIENTVEELVECSSIELSEEDFELQTPYEIYQDGSVHKGSSGQQLFSYTLSPNDKIMGLHVKAQAYPAYPVVAFYNGDTYLQARAVICGNSNIDMDVDVPSEATKICVVNYPNRYATPSIVLKVGISSKVAELDERVTSIEEHGVDSTSILSLNPKCDYEDKIIQLTGKYGNGRNSAVPDPIVFAWFSDIHRDIENLARIKEFTDEYAAYLTNIISTGDNQNYSQDFSWWAEGGANNFLNVLGNHDAWATLSEVSESDTEGQYQGNTLYLIKPKLCYDKYFAPFISNWGVIQPSDAATLGKCYYYKDYTYDGSTTLRLIVLDCMHYNIYSDLDAGNSIQMTWFESVLADARTNGIPVMVAAHYKATNVTKIDCAFNSDDYNSEDSMPLAKEKVDAFIAAGGEFVCWIHGHDHFDMTGVVSPHNFLSLGIDTARCPDVWADEKRIVGTKTQDAFNFIAIDTYEKLIKIVRIGSSYRRNLQHKGVLVYRYAAHDGNPVGIVVSE